MNVSLHARPSTRASRSALLLLSALASANLLGAASLIWDGSNTSNAQADGGTGNWDTTTANWWNGSANVVWPNSASDNEAIFANTGDLVFADAAGVSANKLTFNSTNYYVVGASTLTLNGSTPTISVASGKSAFLGANTALVIAGGSGLVKTGAGTLTINGTTPATLTGGITVRNGTLALSLANFSTSTDVLPATNALSLQGGTLSVTGRSLVTTSQSFSGTSLGGGTSTIFLNKNSGTATLSLGAVTRTAGSVLNVTANTNLAGTVSTTEMVKLTASASATNSGLAAWAVANNPTTSTGRWVSVDASGALKLVTAVTDVADNYSGVTDATKIYNRFSSATLAASATAQAIQNNNTGNNTLTTAIGANTLTVNGLSCIQPGATNLWSFTSTGAGRVVIGAEKELVLIGAGNFAFSAPIADNPGGASGLTFAGGGNVTLRAVNTYTGQTTVNSGVFQLGTGGSIDSSSGVVVNGGTFLHNLTTPLVPTVTANGGTVAGTGTFNALTVPHASTALIGNTGSASLTVGNLTFGGSGSLSLNTAATVPVVVTGTLTTTPANGKVALNLSGITDWGINRSYTLVSYGSWSGSVSDFDLSTLPPLGVRKTASLTSTGSANGTISLTVSGDSTLWTGTNNGNWTTTPVGDPYNWKSLLNGTPTEFVTSDDVVFDDSATGTTDVVISDANVTPSTTFFTNSTKSYTVSSPGGFGIGGFSLTKTGTGTVTLNTANTYTGGTIVSGGLVVTTKAMPSGTTATPASISVAAGAALEYAQNDAVTAMIQGANTYSGAGTIRKSGPGTFTLGTTTSVVALSGGGLIDVQAGTFQAADDNAQSTVFTNNLGDLNIASGATFDGYSTLVRVDKLTGSGTLQAGYFGPRSVMIGVNGGNSTFAGIIKNNKIGTGFGSTPLIKAGNGTITLTGSVNITNNSSDTNAGTDVIRVTGGATLSPSTLTLSPTGDSTIGLLSQSNTVTVSPATNDTAVLNQTAGTINTTTLSVGNQGVGTYNLSGGTTNTKSVLVAFTGPTNGTGEGAINVSGNATLSVQSNGKLTMGSFFGRKATVTQTGGTVALYSDAGVTLGGTGSLAFDGASDASAYNLFGGTLAIPTITLRAAGSGAGGGSGAVNFGGGVLKITSASFTIPTVTTKTVALNVVGDGAVANSGANIDTNGLAVTLNAPLVHSGANATDGGLTKLGAGTLTLSAASTYTGTTTVNAGTLALSGAGSIGSGPVKLVSGSTLDASAATAATFDALQGLSGSGVLNASGKTVNVSGVFAPGALSITGNTVLGAAAQSVFVASASPATTSSTAVTGSLQNNGTLSITPAAGFTFQTGQSFTFATATGGITAGYSSVSVGAAALTQNSPGVWTGTAPGLAYTYTEATATLQVAAGVSLTALEQWRVTYFGSSANTGSGADSADFDNDGIANLLEYATGTNPTVANPLNVTVARSGDHLTLTFTKTNDASLVYTVQGRNDLASGSWSAISPVAGNNPVNGGVGTETVIDPVALSGQPRRFLRLSVSVTAP